MRATLAGLIAISLAAPAAFAQTPPAPAAPAAPMAAPAAPTAQEPSSTPTPTPEQSAPPVSSYSATPPPAPGLPTPSTPETTPPTPAAAPPAAPVAPPAPPPPPSAPTDPTAIALISTLETVCVPAVSGGNMEKLAKSAGYRKSGDNYVMRGKTFQLTVLAPGSNPHTCHVDILSPVDPEAPAKPLVVALHDWAAVTRGYTLYRNDKNVANGQELTTRSWEHSEPGGGKDDALVLTTYRKADGTPSGSRETSVMLFSTNGTAPS
jgi:hypothetical protein